MNCRNCKFPFLDRSDAGAADVCSACIDEERQALLPCPLCGGAVELTRHMFAARIDCRCGVGLICYGDDGMESAVRLWQNRIEPRRATPVLTVA